MADKIYINDEGTLFRVDCETDISSATVFKIKVKKPDDTEVEWNGALYGTQYIDYTIQTDDLDQAGNYVAQAYIETIQGKWSGESFNFEVFNTYD
jgi:hypothetical protein